MSENKGKVTPTLDLTSDEFAALGKIVVASGHLDYFLVASLSELLGLSLKQARVIFINMDTRPKIEMLAALVRKSNLQPNAVSEMQKICADADKIREHRRRLVHGFWGRNESNELVVAQFYGGKDRKNADAGQEYKANAAGITSIANQIIDISNRLFDWRIKHMHKPAAESIEREANQKNYKELEI